MTVVRATSIFGSPCLHLFLDRIDLHERVGDRAFRRLLMYMLLNTRKQELCVAIFLFFQVSDSGSKGAGGFEPNRGTAAVTLVGSRHMASCVSSSKRLLQAVRTVSLSFSYRPALGGTSTCNHSMNRVTVDGSSQAPSITSAMSARV